MHMQKYDYLKFTPLFHSEISSSYLIYVIFENHKKIMKLFLKKFLNLSISHDDISIKREKSYKGKGSVDLFLGFENSGIETHILIEIKVHDYTSTKPEQIRTYYEAALEEIVDGEVYFVYLTQFNKENRPNPLDTNSPPTLQEFEKSKHYLDKDKLTHINWKQFHDFIAPFNDSFSNEEKLMVSLQEKWMNAKTINNIKDNTNDVGERDISDYFGNIVSLQNDLPFGREESGDKRLKYIIELDRIKHNRVELNKVFQVIEKYSGSNNIDKTLAKNTENYTLSAAKDFLSELAQDENNWILLNFYASLFNFINTKKYLILNGKGTTGFSIKVNILGIGEISLCTLWIRKGIRKEKTVEFTLRR
jgi:hypothetical protein